MLARFRLLMRLKHEEFLDTLKAMAGLQDIPVIILSTSSDSVTANKLKAEVPAVS